MKDSFKKGFGFGLTSGIITTLGLIVCLSSSTKSLVAVLGGIIVIAIADSMSDSLGIHIAVEFENRHTRREIWEATLSTFFSKLLIACSFIVWFLIFDLNLAVIASIIWGVLLISVFSYYLAKMQKIESYRPIMEHLIIAVVVIIVTYFVGNLVGKL